MKQFEYNEQNLEQLVDEYNSIYEKLEQCVEEEEKCMDDFDIIEIEKIIEEKSSLFELFKNSLSQILTHKDYNTIHQDVKNSIAMKAENIDKKIEKNIFRMKAEVTFLTHFFNDIKEKTKTTRATYGVYSATKKHAMNSLMHREV